MEPLETLYYAIGELAFVVAHADGSVQNEERKKFHEIVTEELSTSKKSNIDVSDIVFKLMDKKEKVDEETTYNWAIQSIKSYSHYLSPELKAKFIRILEKIAEAYPPVTPEENKIISRFKSDIAPI